MSSRTGRPKADNPKNIDVKVRFDKDFDEDYKKMTPTERAEVDKMMAQLSEIIGLDDDDLD